MPLQSIKAPCECTGIKLIDAPEALEVYKSTLTVSMLQVYRNVISCVLNSRLFLSQCSFNSRELNTALKYTDRMITDKSNNSESVEEYDKLPFVLAVSSQLLNSGLCV